jgi:hypothetical protein
VRWVLDRDTSSILFLADTQEKIDCLCSPLDDNDLVGIHERAAGSTEVIRKGMPQHRFTLRRSIIKS